MATPKPQHHPTPRPSSGPHAAPGATASTPLSMSTPSYSQTHGGGSAAPPHLSAFSPHHPRSVAPSPQTTLKNASGRSPAAAWLASTGSSQGIAGAVFESPQGLGLEMTPGTAAAVLGAGARGGMGGGRPSEAVQKERIEAIMELLR